MKKFTKLFFSMIVLPILSMTVISCNLNTSDNPPVTDEIPNTGENDDSNSQINLAYARNIEPYKGVQEINDLQFANSINLDDEYYLYYFKLGTILNCPIYSSTSMLYTYDTSVTFDFSSLTEEGIENSFTNASETIDTHSYTGGFEITLE